MKKVFKGTGILIKIVVSVVYICCVLAAYVPPSSLAILGTFSLLFPYVLAVMVLLSLVSFLKNRRQGLVLLLVTAAGIKSLVNSFAFNLPATWKAEKNTATLRILTWNIRSFQIPEHDENAIEKINWRTTMEHIKEWDPDVICMQEVALYESKGRPDKHVRVLDSLGYKYRCNSNDSIRTSPNFKAIHGVSIFSKLPLADSAVTAIYNGDHRENLLSADVLFNGKKLRVHTAHLLSFSLYDNDDYSEREELYEKTIQRRRSIYHKIKSKEIVHEQQVRTIKATMAQSPYPVVFCGDINTTPASYTYNLLRSGLQDAYLKAGAGIGKTFYSLAPTLRIDVCFVDKAFSITQCAVKRVYDSDHFPVITDIQWKQ
ncbi:endonuclease/exonuclease/phosphatase family protein [Foetidibacter luteolus]|uniref:endonuclease/exonuclease/phosphatase family protein n=1 Tax=Foetidibacter luteolus TaxID=2608880 RepID=UPI00129B6ECC|nr:endonuclease/exonuclease/phosphatase family protein [Foetidibacter luteolus]